MSHSPVPHSHFPEPLVTILWKVLATQALSDVKEPSTTADGIHEKTLELSGTEYDQLTVFFYNTIGSPFPCRHPQDGTEYTLSFVEKPMVVHETLTKDSRHYTVRMKLMKLPTIPA